MTFNRMPPAKLQAGDSPEMIAAITELENAGIDAKRPSRWQLKLDRHTSFYPDKGTLFVDGEVGQRPERGMCALMEWIKARSM